MASLLNNNGNIPQNMICPFKEKCSDSSSTCFHNKENEFSCPIARSFDHVSVDHISWFPYANDMELTLTVV